MMTKWLKKIRFKTADMLLLAVSAFIFSFSAVAQKVMVKSSADTTAIKIGNQFHLILESTHPRSTEVTWPAVPDTFSLMEVIERSEIDTTSKPDSDPLTLRRVYKLTSFDSGYHVIPPFVFKYKAKGSTNETADSTRPLLITVSSVAVDTTRAIKDIKGQMEVPYGWQDFLPWIAGLLVLLLAGYLIKKYLKNRKPGVVEAPPAPTRPAHEIALEALFELEEAKLWQNGNHKTYHSALSDIIRTFIENRWQVHAMEMTTDEILSIQTISSLEKEVFDKLRYILELADQVKFAKMIPVVFDNEQSMKNARFFVEACRVKQELEEVKA